MAEVKYHDVSISLLKANDAISDDLIKRFNEHGTFTINLLSSPGSGKTMFLEKVLDYFDKERVCVFVGDLETERDAERIRKHGVHSFQIITGGTCHLEAIMIKQSLPLMPSDPDFLFIENVGNLVCPASYRLGEHLRIAMLSTPEGDDKILKYPKAFLTADALIINKSDLLPHLPFDIDKVREEAEKVRPDIEIFVTSALKGEGVETVARFIQEKREESVKTRTASN